MLLHVLLQELLSPLVIVVLLVVMLSTLPPVPLVVLLPVTMLSEPLPMLLFVILFVTTSHVCSDAFTCSHLRTTGHRSRQSPGIVSWLLDSTRPHSLMLPMELAVAVLRAEADAPACSRVCTIRDRSIP